MSRRWIQSPIPPYQLIERDKYVRPKELSHYVMGDIESFVSPLDKTIVHSRRHYREHMARHNVVPAQEYSPEYLAKRRAIHEGEINSKAASMERKQAMWDSWHRAESQ